jgi:cytochrome c-type biogenesis protein CcmH
MKLSLFIIIILSFCAPAMALNIENKLEDPALEMRAGQVFTGIRCMVCAGESIADSRADLAKDLRAVVRAKIKENYTNNQILDYVAQRYGDAILMRPPLIPGTYVLWFGPLIILATGFAVMLLFIKKNRR